MNCVSFQFTVYAILLQT